MCYATRSFMFYSEVILRNLEQSPGLRVNGETVNNNRYADVTVLMVESEEDLQELLDIVVEESEKKGDLSICQED